MSATMDREAAGRVLAAITAKRDGAELTDGTIEAVVADFVAGRVPDYQMAAWLATVACRGMTRAETVALTRAYVDSGVRLNLRDIGTAVVDKHSTGGVGDKITLFVAPVVAACGVAVGKVTGRGLGFAGGTVDKLESISGLKVDLSAAELRSVLAKVGMAISGQSDELVPGDRATYALRDVTATVDSIPLIAASVMSKKIAVGAHGVVLDVKFGEGAVVVDRGLAETLARSMIEIGEAFGLRCRAVLSDMNQPLGYAIGNALEVREAIEALSGTDIPGFTELGSRIAALMLQLADPELTADAAQARAADAVSSGAALAQFRRWVEAQGGDAGQVDDVRKLPRAARTDLITTDRSGWLARIEARQLGEVAVGLGAGRHRYDQPLDHSAGLRLRGRIGDRMAEGDPLVEVHWDGRGDLTEVEARIRSAITFSDGPVGTAPVIDAVL
ncbi:thymidine phosphorylase [Streptomyces sp. NPDC088789]|uniref:thymidine phosphorylase n=1 Tax=Streptomyces sp. NPDC088789 TaxID=3365899 RepID=UPI0037F83780